MLKPNAKRKKWHRDQKKNAIKRKKRKGWERFMNIFHNNMTPTQKKEVTNGQRERKAKRSVRTVSK